MSTAYINGDQAGQRTSGRARVSESARVSDGWLQSARARPSCQIPPETQPSVTACRRVHISLPRLRPCQDGRVVMDPRDALSDEELLRRFNQGDETAFERLVRRYEQALFNFILRSTRDPDQAAELLQEVFLKVVQKSGEFQHHSKVSTWLYTIARNLCIDTSRKMVFRRHRSLDAPSGAEEDGGLIERVASPGTATDRSVIAKDVAARIGEAVDALPEEQREVFLMRELQGMPFKEIADVLSIPENTVKSRMRYALEKLRLELDEYKDLAKAAP